jgi:Ca2+-binding EF-hand superfamily protein
MSTINKRKKHFIPNFEARSVLLVAAMALGAASAVHAQSTAPAMQGTPKTSAKEMDAAFVRADVNKDGKLDKKEAEMMPAIAERFEQLDTNADGFISREEFAKAAGS